MLRQQPNRTTVADWELGLAAVLLLLGVVLTTLVVPAFVV